MNFLNKLNLNARVSLLILAIMVVSFTIFGILIYNTQRNILKDKAQNVLQSQMKDLMIIVELQKSLDSLQNECNSRISMGVIMNKFNNIVIDSADLNQSLNSVVDIKVLSGQETETTNEKALLRNIIFNKKYYNDGHAFCLSSDGKVIIHPQRDLIGKDFSELNVFKKMNNRSKNPIHYKWKSKNEVQSMWAYYTYYEPFDWFIIITVSEQDLMGSAMTKIGFVIILVMFLGAGLFFAGVNLLIRFNVIKPIKKLIINLKGLAKGELVNKIHYKKEDEIGEITSSVNELVDGLSETANFANNIGKGDLDAQFTPLGDKDILGNSLIEMRKSLLRAREEEEKRKVEDEKRNWATQGIAKFGEILRNDNDKIDVLSFNIIKELVDYLNANQGGLFILNDDEEDHIFLEMKAAYAYDRKKYLERKVEIGEGIVGGCIQEKNTVYLKDVPNDYMHITSGLGEEPPKELLLVPLRLNDEVYGVLELASFKEFQQYEIEFVEKIGESIASTVSSVKINIRTSELLEKSQQQAEEMRAQEEEMRQNMEELTATQEALSEKDRENQDRIRSLNEEHQRAIDEVKNREEQNKAVLETAIDGVIIIDQYGIINFFNKAAEEIFGYNRNEAIGKNVKMLMPEEHADFHDSYIRQYMESGESKVIGTGREVPIKLKNGEIKPAFLSLSETKIEDQSLFTGFIKDTSVLIKNKEALKEKEKLVKKCNEKLRATEKEMQEITSKYNTEKYISRNLLSFEFDLDLNIIAINEKLLEILNIKDETSVLNNSYKRLFSEKFKKSKVFQKIEEDISYRSEVEGLFQMETSEGEMVDVKGIAVPYEDENGKTTKYVFQGIEVPSIAPGEAPKEVDISANSEVIEQLEEELSRALEEIDELKAKLAKK